MREITSTVITIALKHHRSDVGMLKRLAKELDKDVDDAEYKGEDTTDLKEMRSCVEDFLKVTNDFVERMSHLKEEF